MQSSNHDFFLCWCFVCSIYLHFAIICRNCRTI
jgi:hypothetical protein